MPMQETFNTTLSLTLPIQAKSLMDNLLQDDNSEKLASIIAKSLELRAKELEIKKCVEDMEKAEEDGEIAKLLREEEKWEDDIVPKAVV
ncbi:hypothetical protein [Campylobacter helveticus]|uniref:hypothetical protein n=1 Tax=Campylobacter helveticus TaxID=28898 RepID=UPI0009C397C6|nr:hypothetical protein [Campylobacter helveticus]ARE80596.1 hypothetical protein CHELV3228_1006 [Campylobacter helveticus]TNH32649.1 hypothetical protein FDW48_06510 [Campylobacter helveticus]TXK52570.1 hypothetical protein A9726_06725 [Campylobacter helveticus]SMC22543.1 hypothetical protein SAMN02745125_01449 [Campylobacter helveticus]SUW83332.1 Uncharacterised protein [Campylobacter helveticus]